MPDQVKKCPLCGNNTIVENYLLENISQCKKCTFMFRDAQVISYNDLKEGAYYSSKKIGNIINKRFIKHFSKRADQHYNFISKFVSDQPRSALDIGCGAGFFLKKLIKNNWTAIGIEPDPIMSRYAIQNGLNVEQKLLDDFDFSKKVGLIYLSHVLDDLPSINSMLEKISNMLMKNGLLFIEVPNYSWTYRLKLTKEEDLKIGQSFFSQKTLLEILSKHGFKKLKQYSFESVHMNSTFQIITSPLRSIIKLKPSKMKSYLRGIYKKV